MKTTGASEERIEQAIAVLSGDYGYTGIGAEQVVGIVCHIVVKPGECAVDVADLRALLDVAREVAWYQHAADNHGAQPSISETDIDMDAVYAISDDLLHRIAALIGGDDDE